MEGVNPEIKYSSSKSVLSKEFGYQFELIYLGVENGLMEILSREFKDDYTKPASMQVAGYEITQGSPAVIVFKGTTIQILRATGNEVEYKVLEGFD